MVGVVAAGLVAILPHAAVAQERATAGDPIDLFTGLHSRESDDIVLDGSPPIRLRRSYRNGDRVSRAFGIGTSHSYNLFLFSDSASLAYVDLILEDGARIHYVRTSPGSGPVGAEYVHTATPSAYFMSRLRWTGTSWDIERRDGIRYRFLPCHEERYRRLPCALIEIRDERGHQLTLARDELGDLTKIQGGWLRTVHLTYDPARRIVQARTWAGAAMTSISYDYDGPGRLVRVHWSHLNVVTVVAELLQSYRTWQWPSLWRMWLEQTMEYTYDDRHQMLIVKEPGMELDHEYDQAGRVIRQQVAGWGTWTFTYTEAQGRVVQTDVVDPDGLHRRVTFNGSGYSLSDTVAPGEPNEMATLYERAPNGNLVTRITVKCRVAIGVPVAVSARVTSAAPEAAVKSRLRSQCAR